MYHFLQILSTSLSKMADELKLAEVIPLFKKSDPFDKINQPVSSFSYMSKVFERIIFNHKN